MPSERSRGSQGPGNSLQGQDELMTLTWEGEEGREEEDLPKAGAQQIREVKAEGGREGLRGLKARPGREVGICSGCWLDPGKEKAAAGEDGKGPRGLSVGWATHMGPEAQGKVTEGSGDCGWRSDSKRWLDGNKVFFPGSQPGLRQDGEASVEP